MLSAELNCAKPVEPPNALEVNHAFTRKMNHLLCVMKVMQKFKALKVRKQARLMDEHGVKTVFSTDASFPGVEEKPAEKAKAEEIEALLAQRRRFLSEADENGKGHARDISEQEPLFLGIGTGAGDDFHMDEVMSNAHVVADSPTAVDFNVYDKAYLEAVEERLRSNPQSRPTMYLTKFVKEQDQLKNLGGVVMEAQAAGTAVLGGTTSKLADLVARVDVDDSKEKGEVVLRD